MSIEFENKKQLEQFLLQKCQAAIIDAENKIYADIKSTLAQFYQEFTPEEYIRTNQLLHSLVKSSVKKVGKGYEAEVYFDVSLLNYNQGMTLLKHTPEHGMYGWATWTGQKVLDVAMTDGLPHGRYETGTPIWTVSKKKMGDILKLLEQKLIAHGIPIRRE